MALVALTTDTPHHTWWVWRLAEAEALEGVVVETQPLEAPFDTHHPFEDERDEWERSVLLSDCPGAIDSFAPTIRVRSVNDTEALQHVKRLDPELTISFGTALIKEPLIRALGGRLLNLHGGDPERYRGLDTHLWAIYHRDFHALETVLHEVDENLDTGALAGRAHLALEHGMPLARLRAVNTAVCLDLTLAALANPRAPRVPQRERGRYYSFMPAVLKGVCVRNFARHVASL